MTKSAPDYSRVIRPCFLCQRLPKLGVHLGDAIACLEARIRQFTTRAIAFFSPAAKLTGLEQFCPEPGTSSQTVPVGTTGRQDTRGYRNAL